MLDQVPFVRPRVALVYGDAGAAGHVREAVAEHVQIVYSTSAAEFDAARLEDSRATAALLNLDSCDWLDAVETWLHAAGVAVVYNDPEISRTLRGWEQARWLRHLTAKLSGSTDFDPPRPVPAAVPPPDVEPAAPEVADARAAQPPETATPVVSETPVGAPAEVMEQPLSLAEIASMTVNFNAVPEEPVVMQAAPAVDLPLASDGRQQFGDVVEAVVTGIESAASMADAAPVAAEDDGPLDVDTEALSALIDARLAEAEGHAPADAPQVWRVAHGGAVSAVDLAPVAEPDTAQANQDAPAAIVQPPAPPVDDSELMQGLPAIDDWQLVDRDAPLEPAASGEQEAGTEPVLAIDFAGLELVPMEPLVQVELHAEPIERRMYVENHDAQVADKNKQPAVPDANGGRA